MLTITITPRAVLLAALLALSGVLAFVATDALGSGTPDAYIQGDTNCDGIVDATDAFNDLRYTAGLTVGPFADCPAIGTEGAIPGPQGPEGPQGPVGPQGEPGITHFANVTADGDVVDGTAVGAVRENPGVYEVEFPQDITSCAPSITVGRSAGGGNSFLTNAFVAAHVGLSDLPGEVRINIRNSQDNLADSDFHLIVAC